MAANLFEEMECPECNADMKEYVTSFKCRNCGWVYKKRFPLKDATQPDDSVNAPCCADPGGEKCHQCQEIEEQTR